MIMANIGKKIDTSVRRIIGFHSARAVLMDVTSPFEKQAGMSLIESLENVLCLCGKMEGPSRVPLISIYLLTANPLQVLPFSCTKGNFVHIHTALTEIRTFLQESLTQFQTTNEKSCVQQAIVEVCSDYRRYIDGLPKTPHNFSQLEIVVLTGHRGQHIQVQFEAAAQQLDLSTIKRVVSATVRSSLTMYTLTGDEGCNDVTCEDTTGLIDVLFLDCDPYSLQSFFYHWLNETSNDSEHLHLILPPPSPVDADLVIQCDLIEQMLSPCQLPFYDVFDLHTESMTCKHVFPTPSKAISMTVPVHHLKAVSFIPLNKLCDSTIFGCPLIVMPTACWKLDWEMTEKNQSNFVCLCNELFKKQVALLTKLVHQTPGIQTKEWPSTRPSNSQSFKPSGFFVLLPSEHRRLLLKSVISRELVLPLVSALTDDGVDQVTEMKIQASLSMVQTVDSFNPVHYESGLWDYVKTISLPKSAVDRAIANRKKAVLLKNKPTSWSLSFESPAIKKSKQLVTRTTATE